MKKKYYSFKLLALPVCIFLLLNCSSPPLFQEAVIQFSKIEHDFGLLSVKEEAACSFHFSNPGKVPLVVSDVKTSCGCMAPDWTHKPIKPGLMGEIKIKYDSALPSTFNKKIKVHYNSPGSPIVLRIKGKVEYPDSKKARCNSKDLKQQVF